MSDILNGVKKAIVGATAVVIKVRDYLLLRWLERAYYKCGYIDGGDGCWKRNVLVTI